VVGTVQPTRSLVGAAQAWSGPHSLGLVGPDDDLDAIADTDLVHEADEVELDGAEALGSAVEAVLLLVIARTAWTWPPPQGEPSLPPTVGQPVSYP
jgi:hypothetical protein